MTIDTININNIHTFFGKRNTFICCLVICLFHSMHPWHSFVLIGINLSYSSYWLYSVPLNPCTIIYWINMLLLNNSLFHFFCLLRQNLKHCCNLIFVAFLMIFLGLISRSRISWIKGFIYFNNNFDTRYQIVLSFLPVFSEDSPFIFGIVCSCPCIDCG